jgi:hypothetical protein
MIRSQARILEVEQVNDEITRNVGASDELENRRVGE